MQIVKPIASKAGINIQDTIEPASLTKYLTILIFMYWLNF